MIRTETTQPFDATTENVYPIQFIQIGNLSNVPAPLVRVTTCGGLQLEVLSEVINTSSPQGRYTVVTLQKRPKGSSTALTLLKILISLPEHYVSKDWLSEHLSPTRSNKDDDEAIWERGLIRVDNVVGLLRSLLCPSGIAEKASIRKVLVEYVKNHQESGPGYRLAPEPLVWLDVDMIAASIKQACLREQNGQNALPSWEQAYTLAAQGHYLPEECYSDWAVDKRIEIDGYLRQAVYALRSLLITRHGQASENRVIHLLRRYWQMHPRDEEALRQLMELLSKHGSIREAQEYYQRPCEVLQQEEGRPDLRTQQTAQSLLRIGHVVPSFKAESVYSSYSHDQTRIPFSHTVPQSIIGTYEPEAHKKLLELVTLQEQDLESNTVMDRREASKYLGILGLTLFTAPHRLFDDSPSVSPRRSSVNRETLTLFSTLTETCLQMSEGSQLITAERVLWSYLPEVEAFAQQSSEHQHFAANIVAQSYLMAASLVGHRNDLQARQRFSEQAWYYGTLAQDCNLQVAALRQLAVTFDYLEQPQKVLQTYHQALPYLDDVSSRLRACIYAALSGVYAQLKQKQEATRFIGLAYEHFPEQTEDEPNFLRLINANYHTIILWDGLNCLELNQPQKAEKIFAGLDVLTPTVQIPERIRIELLNYRSKAFTAVKNMEQACIYLEAALNASIELQSERRLREAFTVFQQIRQQWSHEQRVQQLGDLFFHTLINHT